MKIISWNINGIRSNVVCEGTLKKNFNYDKLQDSNLKVLIGNYEPDIICFQETKCSSEIGSKILPDDDLYPYKYWNESKGEGRRGSGYSGTALWSKIEPNFVNFEYDNFNDDYGRFIYVEYETFCLINIYVPNSGGNYDYRKEWDLKLKKVMDSIQKPLIITGDFNVVSESIDIWNNQPFRLENSPGLYKHEKVMFHSFLENFIDVFRYKYPTKDKKYTWWNTITKSRLQNKGWRIDYFLIQKKFITFVKDCLILDEIMGSDHCPILLELDICQ